MTSLSAASNRTQTASSIQDDTDPNKWWGLSGMEMAFLVTGVVGGVAALFGVVYLILYHTRMSNSSRRKMARQNNNQGDMGMRMSLREESKRRDSARRESSARRSNTQTHFSLFKASKR